MALLDFMKERNAPQQHAAAPSQQAESPTQRSVASLPDSVKAEAVEAARPAAELMNKATTPRTDNAQPSVQNTPDNSPARGRSLGMER
jgi:hypothetical protein